MEYFGGLPLEVVEMIFLKLDKESVLNASNVCIQWKKFIHGLDSLDDSVTDNPVLIQKLEKCGLIMSEHDVEKCKCIEVKIGLFRFIENRDNQMICDELVNHYLLDNDFYGFHDAVSKSRLCVAKAYSCPLITDTNFVSLIDLTEDKNETVEIEIHDEATMDTMYDLKLFAHGNTLVILREVEVKTEAEVDEMITFQKIHLWSLKAMDHVTDLNLLDVLKLDAENDEDITFFGVNWLIIADNKLAVNLFYDTKEQRLFQTHFWKLDTLSPSADNIHHWTKLDHNSDKEMDTIHMNSKFFCGRFESRPEIKLRVFNFEDFTKVSVKNTGIKERCQFNCIEELEQGLSNKFAIFNECSNILQVYDFNNENTSFEFQIDFSVRIGDPDCSLTLANFFLGKMMLVKTFYDNNEQEYLFSFIIVNEVGDVIDGNTQSYMGYFDKEVAFIDKGAVYHIDINGVLAYTNKHEIFEEEDGVEEEEEYKRIHFYH